MEALDNIKTRRSIRRYKDEPVDHELIRKIMDTTIYAPSWKNTQIVRYAIIDCKDTIEKLANEAVLGFVPNIKTMTRARTIALQTVVTGICGYERDGSFSTSKGTGWEMYDAGISAQTFCLAAHEYGVGTVIMGMFEESKIREIVDIPEGESVTAIIGMGYPEEERNAPKHKEVDEVLRFYE
ncbi:MAG: nitroreductase [Clostridia bacterium]|nr:nitroreductase [Clostridia bacterium]NCC44308.1 nitroreductase [Clostridia bacterium]